MALLMSFVDRSKPCRWIETRRAQVMGVMKLLVGDLAGMKRLHERLVVVTDH
jgi:hypothetical protein